MALKGESVEHVWEYSSCTEEEIGAQRDKRERLIENQALRDKGKVLLIRQREVGLITLCDFRLQGVNIRSEEKREELGWGQGGDKKQDMKEEETI